jgi:FAD/FMN-containing dehydrogenase/Fe-S oxidoreductase
VGSPKTPAASSTSGHEVAAALIKAGFVDVDNGVRRRAEYSSDASIYRVVPTVVAFPRHVDDVMAAVAVSRELGVSVTSRGAGTSIAGNSVGSGVILDFSRHMNRIGTVDPAAQTAEVEPGVVLDAISAAAAPFGLRFGPDPSTHSRATIGGSIGNNACGSRALRYGRTSDNVTALDVLTAAGERIEARAFARDGLAAAGRVGQTLDEIVRSELGLIRTEFGRFGRQVSGYSLEHLLPENGRDLARFLVGTEGTLGVVLGATVRLVESPSAVALAVLGYADMPTAADAVPSLLKHCPVAIEGLDSRLVEVVRARRGAAAVPDLPRGDGWLFIETAGTTASEARAAAARIIDEADCLDSRIVDGPAAAALWRIREDGAGLGSRTPRNEPAWPGWEDAAVPPAVLGSYLRDFADLLTEHRLDGLTYGHFGDGCVHVRIDFPLAKRPAAYREFVLAAAALVGRYGGSMSGEHGDGRARSELLPFMYSAEAIGLFQAVKDAFDPDDLLNPGVIVVPRALDADLRLPQARSLRRAPGFAFAHDGGDLSSAVHRCVGVGKCRADNGATGEVMCPSYLATRDEKDSTRGRARVLQELANGELVRGFAAPEVAEALDLCLSCKGCSADCPTGVDMATYKSEVLFQRYRRRLRPAAHYALGWLPRWARLASRAPRIVNAVLSRPAAAAFAKRAGGIDRRRPLPRFAERTFRQDWKRRRQLPEGVPVLLWLDTFTDRFSPDVGWAAVKVLEAAGYQVQVLERSVCCGLTWISTGQLDGARRQMRRALDELDAALTAGMPVVGLEPSCTAVMRSEIVDLLPDDPRAGRLAAQTHTLAEFLTATPGWVPPAMPDVKGIAQPHCHQHAVLGWSADESLLVAAGATVESLGGCCGMAGNFGVERGHYDVSVRVAENALLPALNASTIESVVLADGFSCRTQIDQLAGRRGLHLAELLARYLVPTTDSVGELDQPSTEP